KTHLRQPTHPITRTERSMPREGVLRLTLTAFWNRSCRGLNPCLRLAAWSRDPPKPRLEHAHSSKCCCRIQWSTPHQRVLRLTLTRKWPQLGCKCPTKGVQTDR